MKCLVFTLVVFLFPVIFVFAESEDLGDGDEEAPSKNLGEKLTGLGNKKRLRSQYADEVGIREWLNSPIPRGDQEIKNPIAKNNSFKYCTALGCRTKVPMYFNAGDIRMVAEEMGAARKKHNCMQDTPSCERLALQYGVRVMDRIVKSRKLNSLSKEDMKKHSVDMIRSGGDNTAWMNEISHDRRFVRDCVDQAANGTNFLIILGDEGMLVHHKVISPGVIHLGPQPHYFTRIKSPDKGVLRFDLYRTPRDDFDKLPGITGSN